MGISLNGFSQSHSTSSQRIIACFANVSSGEVSINDHLTDSLQLTSPELNHWFRIGSFHLTVICKSQVLKYLENNNGNKLTAEMKDALKKYHPGCHIYFEGIKLISTQKDINDKYPVMDCPGIMLTLK